MEGHDSGLQHGVWLRLLEEHRARLLVHRNSLPSVHEPEPPAESEEDAGHDLTEDGGEGVNQGRQATSHIHGDNN